MSKPYIEISDFTKEFNETISKFKKDAVLIGIPELTANRKPGEEDEGKINNATILAINVFGSPANNIPPRDVMSQGIKDAQPEIAEQFKLAAQKALTVGVSALTTYYERAGIIASNSVKKAINNQEWPAEPGNEKPAESTLKARKSKGFSGSKSLIVSGQLRNSITYVVNKGGL